MKTVSTTQSQENSPPPKVGATHLLDESIERLSPKPAVLSYFLLWEISRVVGLFLRAFASVYESHTWPRGATVRRRVTVVSDDS